MRCSIYFPRVTPPFFVCLFFSIFYVLALLALFVSFFLSPVCSVAMAPVGVISIWNDEKRQTKVELFGPV